MLYVVVVDAMDDPVAAAEWLRLDGALQKHRKAVRLMVCCEADGAAVLEALCTPHVCRSAAHAAYEGGKLVARLPARLENIAVFVVTFDGGVACCRRDGAWTELLLDDLVALPGAETCVGLTPPPHLAMLLEKVAQNAQLTAPRRAAARGGYEAKRVLRKTTGAVSACGRCGKTLWNDADRAAHAAQLARCEYCPKEFCTAARLHGHIKREHPRCDDPACGCDAAFPSPAALEQHRRELRYPIACRVCGAKFTSLKRACAHAKTAHPDEQPFVVDVRHFQTTVTHVCCMYCGHLGGNHTCPYAPEADAPALPAPAPAKPTAPAASTAAGASTDSGSESDDTSSSRGGSASRGGSGGDDDSYDDD